MNTRTETKIQVLNAVTKRLTELGAMDQFHLIDIDDVVTAVEFSQLKCTVNIPIFVKRLIFLEPDGQIVLNF